ncbi:MAG: creatininase family protein [Thermoleophilia bacterium]|nr:creatininase family protein [Thermoleophilia bacterium]
METTPPDIAGRGPVLWDELTWEQVARLVADGMDMAILPVGATEQHGPHLPLGMDTLAAVTVAHGVSARTGIPVLPALPVGCSLGHTTRWPGTLSLRPATLAAVVTEVAAWLHAAGVRRLLLLNGHVTNAAPLRCALEVTRHDLPGMRVALRSLWEASPEAHRVYHDDAANFHANRAETSLVLAVRPDLVHMDRAVDEPDRGADHFFAYPVDHETRTGTVGAPTGATADEGARLIEECVASLSAQLSVALTEDPPITPEDTA